MRIPTLLPPSHPGRFEFHISRAVRDRHDFDQDIFTLNGNVILANVQAVQTFTKRLNDQRHPGTPPFHAGQINAMGLIDEILHLIMALYRQKVKPKVMAEALEWLEARLGEQARDRFGDRFGYGLLCAVIHGRRTQDSGDSVGMSPPRR